MADQEQDNFEAWLDAISAMRDILFMYWTLVNFRGLYWDFGEEDGTFDPLVYIDYDRESLQLGEDELQLLHEGSGIKILCAMLQHYSQGGYPNHVSSFMKEVRRAVEAGRFEHLPPIERAVREGLSSSGAIDLRSSELYNFYVAARFEQLAAKLEDPYPCPCCGSPSFDEPARFEICPICKWEDDGQGDDDADRVRGGPNRDYSLAEARRNFETGGTMFRSGDDPCRRIDVAEIRIDEKRLIVRATDSRLTLTHIYRASSHLKWDSEAGAVWVWRDGFASDAVGFIHIMDVTRAEYGVDFVLSGSTRWRVPSGESRESIQEAWASLPPYEPKATPPVYLSDPLVWSEERSRHLARLELARKRIQSKTAFKPECDVPCPDCGETFRVKNPSPEDLLREIRVARDLFNAADANTPTRCQQCGESVNVGWYFAR